MTQIIIYKIMAVAIAGFGIFWYGSELRNHVRYRDQPHRWQWRSSRVENRSSDILWLRDRFWMVFRLATFLAMAVGVGYICVTR